MDEETDLSKTGLIWLTFAGCAALIGLSVWFAGQTWLAADPIVTIVGAASIGGAAGYALSRLKFVRSIFVLLLALTPWVN